MKLSAYKFAIPRFQAYSHGQLFDFFKDKAIPDYTEHKVIFAASERFILVRTAHLAKGIPAKEDVVELKHKVKGHVLLASLVQKRFYKDDGTSEQRYVNMLNEPEWFNSHITNLLEKAGLKNIKHEFVTTPPVYAVQKFKRSAIPTVDVSFTAEIDDPELLKKAWINGIGRLKTYGFGMLRIEAND